MKRAIHKYALLSGANRIDMPRGATVLSVANQHGACCLWAEVDTAAPKVPRIFSAEMTGWEFSRPEHAKFVGTVLLDSGLFVLHVYDHGEMA